MHVKTLPHVKKNISVKCYRWGLSGLGKNSEHLKNITILLCFQLPKDGESNRFVENNITYI